MEEVNVSSFLPLMLFCMILTTNSLNREMFICQNNLFTYKVVIWNYYKFFWQAPFGIYTLDSLWEHLDNTKYLMIVAWEMAIKTVYFSHKRLLWKTSFLTTMLMMRMKNGLNSLIRTTQTHLSKCLTLKEYLILWKKVVAQGLM